MTLEGSTTARVVCDTVTSDGHRATTMVVTLWREVLAELNTHRMLSRGPADQPSVTFQLEEFSRNSASSRAIPLSKMLERVETDPAVPAMTTEQKGMQGGATLVGKALDEAEDVWVRASRSMVNAAADLGELQVHKSVANRLLEPFLMHTVVLTATSWDGFFEQRLDKHAQTEIRWAAEAMYRALDQSEPTLRHQGEWHLPFISEEDIRLVADHVYDTTGTNSSRTMTRSLVKVSTARCARVSYLTHDGRRDVAEDFALHDRLVEASPTHFSPAEHPCTPAPQNVRKVLIPRRLDDETAWEYEGPAYGNLTGFHQYRFDLMGR